MVRRTGAKADVSVERRSTVLRPTPGTRVLAIVLDGTASLRREPVRLGRLDAVLFHDDEDPVGIAVDGVLAVVSLTDVR